MRFFSGLITLFRTPTYSTFRTPTYSISNTQDGFANRILPPATPAVGHGRCGLHLAARSKIGRIVAVKFRECASHGVGIIAVASLDGFACHDFDFVGVG